MKVNFYCDVWGGAEQLKHGFYALSMPIKKTEGSTRLRFVVDIPDHLIYGTVDAEMPVESVEVMKEAQRHE